MSPHLFYVGNNEADYATEMDIARAFRELGWSGEMMHEREFMRNLTDQAGRDVLRGKATEAQLVMHTLTQGSYPDETAVLDLWAFCRDRAIPTASLHLDLFYGLSSPKDSGPQRCDLPRLHPMFKVDHVFTADGDHDAEFARDGVNHYWLPPGVRYDEARDIEPIDEDRATFGGFDVGFCGARGYHPEHDRAGLIDALEARYGDRFVRVAGDTKYGTIRGEALNRLYATVPVWVGDSCFAGTSSRYTSDRFFETWGRGGFLVHPWMKGIKELYGPRGYPGWRPYENREAMFGAVNYWLAQPERREEVRREIAAEVRAQHTYVNRVREMLDVIGLPYEGKPVAIGGDISVSLVDGPPVEPGSLTWGAAAYRQWLRDEALIDSGGPIIAEAFEPDEIDDAHPGPAPTFADVKRGFERLAERAETLAGEARAWAQEVQE